MITEVLERLGLEHRSQDLASKRSDRLSWHRRGWVQSGRTPYQTFLRWEATIPGTFKDGSVFAGVVFDADDSEVRVRAGLGPALYLGFPVRDKRLWRLLRMDYETRQTAEDRNVRTFGGEREIAVRIHDGAIWWELWHPPMFSSSSTPKWRSGNFNFVDAIFGRAQYESETLERAFGVEIPMPERTYLATVELKLKTWKRPRSFFRPLIRRTALVEVDGGIPVPGKGTASYNCGQDAIYSISTNASTVPEAVAGMVRAVVDSRLRDGGKNWRPARD